MTIVWCAFAIGIVANKIARELGPEWCARYMVVKYMLYLEDGSCSSVGIEPPMIDIRPGSQAGN